MSRTEKEDKGPKFEADTRRITLMRRSDKRVAALFLVLFALSIFLYWFAMANYGFTVYTGLPIMATPFFVIGVIYYVLSRRIITGAIIILLSVIAYFLMPSSVLFLLYLLVCAEGVAIMVEVIQRASFFYVLSSIQRINIKKDMSIDDRIISFFFNIPVDLDTRNLVIDTNVARSKLPWKDMLYTMLLALLFCMFMWIYFFLNPALTLETTGVPIYTFTIILYLSMIVMPWTIFSALNARIKTEYRDFKLHTGLLGTLTRMFLPIMAAIIFLIAALSSGWENIYYIIMSLGMIVVMIVFTSVMYYTRNEMSVVNDILSKWSAFHPTDIYSGFDDDYSKSSLKDDVPGTPRRDPMECFYPELRIRGR